MRRSSRHSRPAGSSWAVRLPLLGFALLGCGGNGTAPSPHQTPAQLSLAAGGGQYVRAGEAVPIPPAVEVRDSAGRPVSQIAVHFQVRAGGGSVAGGDVNTGADGIARVSAWTLGPAVGADTLAAAVAGLQPVLIPGYATAPIVDLSIDPSPDTLELGQTLILSALGRDSAGETVPIESVAWSSAEPTVASVTAAGQLTGAGSGATRVTATADGATASLNVTVHSGTVFYQQIAASDTAVWAASADGSGARRLTPSGFTGYQPAVRLDGALVAYVGHIPVWSSDVYVMAVDGSESRFQTYTGVRGAANVDPTWSPDGGRIAFASDRGTRGVWKLFVMDTGGGGQRLLEDAADARSPSWSPDGARVAFERTVNGNTDIYIARADAYGTTTRLTTNPAYDGQPRWSPDGSTILFSSTRDGNREIYRIGIDGTGLARLTNNPADDRDPTWSPRGFSLAFRSDRSGIGQIYRMRLDGTGTVAVTSGGGDKGAPAWGP